MPTTDAIKDDINLWAIVPAAGIGRRMREQRPKQYLTIAGEPVLSLTLQRLAALPNLQGIVVALHPEDDYWSGITQPANVAIHTVTGGDERCDSVLNALLALDKVFAGMVKPQDWVLVHDAARPCVRVADMQQLLADIDRHPVGGLLALPIADTVKQTDASQTVTATLDRRFLWRALTPQVFRYAELLSALQSGIERQQTITDEAQAMEYAGHRPLLIAGHADNIKITRPEDLAMAEWFLQQQQAISRKTAKRLVGG